MAGGLAVFWQYENKAGTAAVAPGAWPVDSKIVRPADRPTLIIIAHPHCPCTRATVHELERLMSEYPERLSAYVIFVRPNGVDQDWERTDNWEAAGRIPGVSVLVDDMGVEARLFDARVSGQTMLYSKNGDLLFTGGITAGRGLEGVSVGESAIAAIIDGEMPDVRSTNVYGCPLLEDEAYCHTKGGETNETVGPR